MTELAETEAQNTAILLQQVSELKQMNQVLREENDWFREQLSEMERRMFGRSSEKTPDLPDGQLSFFEAEKQAPSPAPQDEVIVHEHKRKKKGAKAAKMTDLPTRTIAHELPEEEQFCEVCGSRLTDMGTSLARTEIEFHQAEINKLEHQQHSYVCKNCERQGETVIKKAPIPRPLINNSLGSPSIVTETIMQKYQQKVPAYRQEKYWQTLGLDISRDNICHWHILVVLNVLMPIFSLLRQALVKQSIVMADETSYRVIESKKCETYYWMFCSGHLEAHPIVLYHHAESRGHEVPQEFLTGFCGYLQCDGWTAYPLLPDVTLVYCGAHIRRKFFEALSNKKDPPKNSPAYIGFDYWNQMFTVEKQMKHLSPEERVNQRKVKLKPLLDAFGEWLDQLPVLPKSKLGIAVEYAAKHFKSLYLLLEDGRLELSNNRSERMIKELVIGRKNWLHSATLEGATASGIILSIMKTAEENKLDVCKYFNYLFTEIPNLPVMDNASLEKFLPWSKDIQSLCK